jgi:hypothetical protein
MAFDEEDRRGEPLPEERKAAKDNAETEDAKSKPKRKKRSSKEAGLNKDGASANAQGDDWQDTSGDVKVYTHKLNITDEGKFSII